MGLSDRQRAITGGVDPALCLVFPTVELVLSLLFAVVAAVLYAYTFNYAGSAIATVEATLRYYFSIKLWIH